ncbi:MAG TPA: MFS transporter [Hyphomicrobiaceae bacterium]|nr:MFS transporter [Hyphomicrobiaceae bacterium]
MAGERERRSLAARLSLLFAALSVIIGTQLPYLPVWLDWAGLGASEIAVITGMPLIVRVAVAPTIAFAADRVGDHRKFLIGLAWVGLAGFVAMAHARSFWSILAWTIVSSLAWTTILPLTEAAAMRAVKRAGLDYGRMRLWGSLSFIAASFVGGWAVARLGGASAIWLVVAGAAMTVAATHGLTPPMQERRSKPATGRPRLAIRDAVGLLRSRAFLLLLIAAGLTQASHAAFYTFGTLHWRALGLSTAWSGALWAVSIVAEVALFAYSAAVVRRIGPAQLIVLGAGAAVLRWLIMGLDPALFVLLPLQLLHALTFGATHIGALHYIGRGVPDTQAGTAQALYASITGGIATGGITLMAGPIYAACAGRVYWAMALVAAAALLAGLALAKARGGA